MIYLIGLWITYIATENFRFELLFCTCSGQLSTLAFLATDCLGQPKNQVRLFHPKYRQLLVHYNAKKVIFTTPFAASFCFRLEKTLCT